MTLLDRYEADIEQFETAYAPACVAVLTIAEDDLWAQSDANYQSFEEYCDRRWGYSKSYASRLKDQGRLLLEFQDQGIDPPPNERIAREVMRVKAFEQDDSGRWHLDEEKTWKKRAETWEAVKDQADANPTADEVRYYVDINSGRGAKAGPSLEKLKKLALSQLGRALDKVAEITWTDDERRRIREIVEGRIGG